MTKLTQSSWHGVDAHVLATLIHRSWTVVAGGITMLLIPFCMNAVEQGYYFSFASILALQIFFELGMGQVVIQIVAHEAAHLRQGADGSYEGDAEHMARLTLLRVQLRRWYLTAALLFMSVVCGAGLLFFSDDSSLPWSHWAPAWASLVVATAINLYFSWKMSMIEGFALVKNIAQLRLFQSIIGYVLMWAGLLAGAGLWVVVAVPLTSAIATAFWIKVSAASKVLRIRSNKAPDRPISWTRDILPFQWRIAISWISGYFIFQLFTPLIFRHHGAEEAGRLGLAIAAFSALSTIGLSWINAKSAKMAMLIAQKKNSLAVIEFRNAAVNSGIFTIIVSALFLVMVLIAFSTYPETRKKIVNLEILFYILISTFVNVIIYSCALFMRAHREEPMLPVSVTIALVTLLMTWHLADYGSLQLMQGYAAITLFLALPWTLLILRKYLNR